MTYRGLSQLRPSMGLESGPWLWSGLCLGPSSWTARLARCCYPVPCGSSGGGGGRLHGLYQSHLLLGRWPWRPRPARSCWCVVMLVVLLHGEVHVLRRLTRWEGLPLSSGAGGMPEEGVGCLGGVGRPGALGAAGRADGVLVGPQVQSLVGWTIWHCCTRAGARLCCAGARCGIRPSCVGWCWGWRSAGTSCSCCRGVCAGVVVR